MIQFDKRKLTKSDETTNYHNKPTFPSFLGVISPIYWSFKTFMFHGFGGSWCDFFGANDLKSNFQTSIAWHRNQGLNLYPNYCREILTWPMANLLNFLGMPYLVGKIKFKLLFQGPLAKWGFLFCINIPGPSKGCQMLRKKVSILLISYGFNWHPLEGAGICMQIWYIYRYIYAHS